MLMEEFAELVKQGKRKDKEFWNFIDELLEEKREEVADIADKDERDKTIAE